jgi:hypothetical protein
MHDSISFPLQQQCLTPISGHFEQGFFIADSNEESSYTTPPPKIDECRAMEQRMLQFHHIHNDFTPNDIAQAIWTGKAIIGTKGSASTQRQRNIWHQHPHPTGGRGRYT